MKTLLTTGFVALSMLATAGTASACPPGEKGGGGSECGQAADGPRSDRKAKRMEKMITHLGLTAEQKTAAQTLHDKKHAFVKPLRKKMQANRQALEGLWKAESLDVPALKKLRAEGHALRGKMANARFDFRVGMHAILTPDQRQKAQAFMKTRGGKGRHNRRGGGPL